MKKFIIIIIILLTGLVFFGKNFIILLEVFALYSAFRMSYDALFGKWFNE
jgi:hypothetical protein